MKFTPAEINAAQFEMNRHPDNSPFWDSPDGQDVLELAHECNLVATNTNADRREIFRNFVLAVGGDECLARVNEDFVDRAHHLTA